jgi:hypothetical protein
MGAVSSLFYCKKKNLKMHIRNALCLSILALNLSMSSNLMAQTTPLTELQKSPSVTLTNGLVSARVYLPDETQGFYRGVRFDWAGMIGSLTYAGHDFYPPWFEAMSPEVRDFENEQGYVTASPQTAATGPVEEFNAEGGALGYAEAAPGETFVKIGVGVLRRLDDSRYHFTENYPLVDAGERINIVRGNQIEFLHRVNDEASGYGYEYIKTLRLEPGQPALIMEHQLLNTGSKQIDTEVYNHNFLNIDDSGSSEGLTLSVPYRLDSTDLPNPALASVDQYSLTYLDTPPIGQSVRMNLSGFDDSAEDYDFRTYHQELGAGVRITGDQPMSQAVLWSVAPVMSVEPFIAMSLAPGEGHSWSYRYEFEAD